MQTIKKSCQKRKSLLEHPNTCSVPRVLASGNQTLRIFFRRFAVQIRTLFCAGYTTNFNKQKMEGMLIYLFSLLTHIFYKTRENNTSLFYGSHEKRLLRIILVFLSNWHRQNHFHEINEYVLSC